MKLKNKIALVTGGNSGLGFEVVKELIKKNCQVISLERPDAIKMDHVVVNRNKNI